MSAILYNGSVILGLLLISIGCGLVHMPTGLISGGVLLLAITIYHQHRFKLPPGGKPANAKAGK